MAVEQEKKKDREIAFLEFFLRLSVALEDEWRQAGKIASGETVNSLRVEVTPQSGTLFGGLQALVLEDGRKPSSKGGGGDTLQQRIRKWIDVRGISPSDITKDSLSWAISKSIHKKGDLLFRTGRDFQGNEGGYIRRVLEENSVASFTRSLSGIEARAAVESMRINIV